MKYYCFLFLIITQFSCEVKQHPIPLKGVNQPNIIWIVAEDLSEYIPSYGDSTVLTPHLSRLAKEGVCYDRFFSPAAVCAPARSAIATGMYPTRIGSNHMRTGPWFMSNLSQSFIDSYSEESLPDGISSYEAILPDGVKMMSETLRENGYYCTNNSKEDYQFKKSLMAWDESSNEAHWKNRKEGQPFFSVFNINITHESQIWSKWARKSDSLWVNSDLNVPVPPYLPDTDVAKNDIRRMYSNIKMMDARVGEIISELEAEGLLDETIIFWYTDHGGPLPRQKRLLYDSGIKVPMIVRFPDERGANTRNTDMTSFIDLAPTVLSLAGIPPSEVMDGEAFLGKFERKKSPQYVFAAADRFDETYDKNRAVRDDRFKYIRYFLPDKSMFLHVNYRDQMPIMQELYRLRDEGLLTDAQKQWFRDSKPEEELFDTQNDPHELHNLAEDPAYTDKLKELQKALDEWMKEVPDQNFQSEKEYLHKLWPDGTQPVTALPQIAIQEGHLSIKSITENASLGFQILTDSTTQLSDSWEVYVKPIPIPDAGTVKAISHRVGYKPSEVVSFDL